MGNRLPPKNATRWYQPRGVGYITGSGQENLQTQSGVDLLTQSGENIITNPNVYKPKFITSWTKAVKELTSWRPLGGHGYVVSQTATNIATNSGFLLTDNLGNFIVPNPTYTQPKNVTAWTASGT